MVKFGTQCIYQAVILVWSCPAFCLFFQGGFQALARRASEERFLQRAEQDQTYIGVSGNSSFLWHCPDPHNHDNVIVVIKHCTILASLPRLSPSLFFSACAWGKGGGEPGRLWSRTDTERAEASTILCHMCTLFTNALILRVGYFFPQTCPPSFSVLAWSTTNRGLRRRRWTLTRSSPWARGTWKRWA